MTEHNTYRPLGSPGDLTVMLKATVRPTGRIERISIEVRSPVRLLWRLDHRDDDQGLISWSDLRGAAQAWVLFLEGNVLEREFRSEL